MAVKPIRLEPEEIHVHADRRLAFEVLTAFGAKTAEPGHSTTVLQDEGSKKLVEFHTPVALGFGRVGVFKTVEWVVMYPPELITFDLVPAKGLVSGALRLLDDRFVFTDSGGCTVLRYESTFGLRWSWIGQLLGYALIAPIMRRHMREHLESMKETIEARARRSRKYPQVECAEMQRRRTV